MKTLIVILVLFSSSLFGNSWSYEKQKIKPIQYLKHLTDLSSTLFICNNLEDFYLSNKLINNEYLTLTGENYDNLLTKDERNMIYDYFDSMFRENIKNDFRMEAMINELGGCKSIAEKVKNLYFTKYSLPKDEWYFDRDIKLKSTNFYFGLKIKEDIINLIQIDNGKITNLIPTHIPMVVPQYEIIPPIPNSLFNKYIVKGYHGAEVSHLINWVDARYDSISLSKCLEKKNILINHYKKNQNAKFIVSVGSENHILLKDYENYSKEYLLYKEIRVVMEFDNNDESVQLACFISTYNRINKIDNYDLRMIIYLVPNHERKTDILKGL